LTVILQMYDIRTQFGNVVIYTQKRLMGMSDYGVSFTVIRGICISSLVF